MGTRVSTLTGLTDWLISSDQCTHSGVEFVYPRTWLKTDVLFVVPQLQNLLKQNCRHELTLHWEPAMET